MNRNIKVTGDFREKDMLKLSRDEKTIQCLCCGVTYTPDPIFSKKGCVCNNRIPGPIYSGEIAKYKFRSHLCSDNSGLHMAVCFLITFFIIAILNWTHGGVGILGGVLVGMFILFIGAMVCTAESLSID